MSTKDDGGPAFPVEESALIRNLQGMSLRDYFAAKAMQGFCAHHAAEITPALVEDHAFIAYKIADAMLKERAK